MYSYISSIYVNRFFLDKKRHEKNLIDMDLFTMLGGVAASTGMSMLDEWLMGDRRRRQQLEQQQKLTNQQVEANKALANHGMGISKELWDYTNYENQRKHMENAGLNPALMYGHAGAGGTTASTGAGSASGGIASDEMSRKMASIQAQGMALQNSLLHSQIKNIDADTEQKLATAEKTKGVDTDLVKANIADITQSIKNKQVQEIGQNLQNDYDKIRNYISENTAHYDIGYIGYMAGQARENWQMLINNREISDASKDEIIKNYELMNKNIISDMLLKSKQSYLAEAQVNKMSEDILQGWKDLEIKEIQGDRRLTNEERANDIRSRFPSLNQLGGGIVNELLITLDKLNPLSKGGGWSSK
jgi:hypothetical protein